MFPPNAEGGTDLPQADLLCTCVGARWSWSVLQGNLAEEARRRAWRRCVWWALQRWDMRRASVDIFEVFECLQKASSGQCGVAPDFLAACWYLGHVHSMPAFVAPRAARGQPVCYVTNPPARIAIFMSHAANPRAPTLQAQMTTNHASLTGHLRFCSDAEDGCISGTPLRALPFHGRPNTPRRCTSG